jgi:hypothetical protein
MDLEMLKDGSMAGQINQEIKTFKHRHGGARVGAGRKRGSGTQSRCAECSSVKAILLARAAQDCRPLPFVLAAFALGIPIDEVRRALGMSSSQFAALYLLETES